MIMMTMVMLMMMMVIVRMIDDYSDNYGCSDIMTIMIVIKMIKPINITENPLNHAYESCLLITFHFICTKATFFTIIGHDDDL